MKQCPKCNRTYDDSQAFCLMDGTPLTNEGEVETVLRRQTPPPKKSRFLLWLALTGLVILFGGAAVAGLLIYKFSKQDESKQVKKPTVVNAAKSPSAPKATPAAAVETSSPDETTSAQTETPTPDDTDSDEITPIGWDTTATGFKNDASQTYKFQCPAQGTEHAIWGSDVYTLDSSICTAAVHAGLFSLADGGVVTVEFRPGRLTYGSTNRHGITSHTYGEYPRSFVVR